jgi:predicted PurR-regulated permease PerM
MLHRADAAVPRAATRSRLSLLVLLTMTGLGIALCAAIVSPFVTGLVWALSLAIVASPVHRVVARRIRQPSIAAGTSTLLVTLMLVVPTLVVAWQVGVQLADRVTQVERLLDSGAIGRSLRRFPAAERLYHAATDLATTSTADPTGVAQPVARTAGAWLQAAIAVLVQILIALFALFFLFRDRVQILAVVRSLMPMSNEEADYLFESIRSMTRATLYGTIVVSFIQGTLGGVMFALLGIPAALLWGLAMALLSTIPSAGAFVIWLPAAIVLAAQGEVGKAAILAVWGALAVGTIDNALYPMLVGKEMRLHPLPVFLAIVGGLFLFGAAGIVLGPVVLAATIALITILKRRTSHGRSAERPRSSAAKTIAD